MGNFSRAADEDELLGAQHDGDEALGLRRLRRLIDEALAEAEGGDAGIARRRARAADDVRSGSLATTRWNRVFEPRHLLNPMTSILVTPIRHLRFRRCLWVLRECSTAQRRPHSYVVSSKVRML